jgi:hypothetical protein
LARRQLKWCTLFKMFSTGLFYFNKWFCFRTFHISFQICLACSTLLKQFNLFHNNICMWYLTFYLTTILACSVLVQHQ